MTAAIRCGDLDADPSNCEIHWKGRRVVLSLTAARVVMLLAATPGHPVPFRAIYEAMKGREIIAFQDANVRSIVKRARAAFAKVDPSFDEIVSRSGIGYEWRLRPALPFTHLTAGLRRAVDWHRDMIAAFERGLWPTPSDPGYVRAQEQIAFHRAAIEGLSGLGMIQAPAVTSRQFFSRVNITERVSQDGIVAFELAGYDGAGEPITETLQVPRDLVTTG